MQKQSRIPGADLETVSALLRQLAPEAEQQMAFVNEPSGRICSWGLPLAECYEAAGCCLDTAPGRVFYFVHDCVRFWKYIRPVVRF